MNLENCKKILIIRFSSLGDILLTTPLLRALKSQYPQLKIDFIVRDIFKDTIANNPNIDKLYKLNNDYNSKVINSELKANGYDLIIDLQSNLRSYWLTRNLNIPILKYNKPYLNRILLVKFNINRFDNIISIPERYANAIPGFSLDNEGLELFIPESFKSKLKNDTDYIGFCPGAKHKTKMWPKNYFIELGKLLIQKNLKIVLLGGKDDLDICKKISNQIPNSINLANNNDLLQLGADMKLCKTIVCNDSGLMHTALSVGTPVISIFGSTVKEFGFSPYKGKNLVLENNLLSCRPCSHIGLDECPKNHLNCMNEITPNTVFNEAQKFIKTL